MPQWPALWLAAASLLVGLPAAAAEEAAEEGSCSAGSCGAAGGLSLPRVVVGCWQLLERHADRSTAVETLMAYARAGFTTFDTADIYGPSESILGEFRKQWVAENQDAPQLRFFTKYVTDDTRAAEADRINSRSRNSLGVEALDMVQFHWWSLSKDGSERNFLKAGHELARLKLHGRILHLGACNMDTTNLKLMVDDGMGIESNQVQYSLVDRRPEVRLLEYCREHGIKLAIFGVVAGGLLSERFMGLSMMAAMKRLDSVSRRMYWSSLQRWNGGNWDLFQRLLKSLEAIGHKHQPKLSVAAVACGWALQRMEDLGAGGGLILGVRDARHLEEHAAVLRGDAHLSSEDMAAIQAVLDQGAPPSGDIWYEERGWA